MAILEAVSNALMAFDYAAQDGATVALAGKLAQEIDATEDPKLIGDLSSRLLTVLTALGMTPASRTGAIRGAGRRDLSADPISAIDELRERRTRSNRTKTVDPSA